MYYIRTCTGNAVAQLVEILGYKSESLGFDSWPHYFSEFDSASDRNEYRKCIHRVKGSRYVRLKTLPLSLLRPYNV